MRAEEDKVSSLNIVSVPSSGIVSRYLLSGLRSRQSMHEAQGCPDMPDFRIQGLRSVGCCSANAAVDYVQEELPPWARKDELKKLAEKEGKDLPFGLYLFLATIMGIVAVRPFTATGLCCPFGNVSPVACKTHNENCVFTALQLWHPLSADDNLLTHVSVWAGGIGVRVLQQECHIWQTAS